VLVSSVGASLQWVPVFSGCQSSVGASLQWVPVFSGCQSSVSASAGVMHQLACCAVESLARLCIRREIAPPHLPLDFLPYLARPALSFGAQAIENCPSLKIFCISCKIFCIRPRKMQNPLDSIGHGRSGSCTTPSLDRRSSPRMLGHTPVRTPKL
jgi:hypothetical protein